MEIGRRPEHANWQGWQTASDGEYDLQSLQKNRIVLQTIKRSALLRFLTSECLRSLSAGAGFGAFFCL